MRQSHPVASVVHQDWLTPEALDVVSVVLEAPEAAGEHGYGTAMIGCPFRSCLEEYRGACRPSLPGLAKVCRLLRGVSEHEPAAATDMSADKPSFKRGLSFTVPLIRMVYEANPAAISHQVSAYGLPLHQCLFNTTSIPFAMCTHCIQRLPRSPDRQNNSALCSAGQVRKYSPGSQLLSREHISESCRFGTYIHL
jgi:hypothetical protein